MKLDVDGGKLEFCVVGQTEESKQARLWNLPSKDSEIEFKGWVPHFNIFEENDSVKIAYIPVGWYGIEQYDVFEPAHN